MDITEQFEDFDEVWDSTVELEPDAEREAVDTLDAILNEADSV